jgi:hypothetical protein
MRSLVARKLASLGMTDEQQHADLGMTQMKKHARFGTMRATTHGSFGMTDHWVGSTWILT